MLTHLASKAHARHRSSSLVVSIAVVALAMAPAAVSAAELYGQVSHPNGAAVTNQPILLKGKEIGKTDASGAYRLSLPPGQYTLTIAGKNVPVVVPPPGVKQDIKLP